MAESAHVPRKITVVAGLTGAAVLVWTGLLVVGLVGYMREDSQAATLGAVVGLFGAVTAGTVFLLVRKLAHRKIVLNLAAIVLSLLVLIPISAILPGGITHARFGLTVVGAMPIPVFDFVLHANGLPWFRNKSHRIQIAELQALATGAEIIVVGTGWQGVASLEGPASGLAVETYETPEAIRRYHELRRQGRRVALLLHSTC
jgi:hypothetical protein